MSQSYWLDRKHSSRPRTVLDAPVDVIVVGGGLSGLSVAYWLLQHDPSLKVHVLEKDRLGAGATGRNAGFVTCGSVEHFNRMVSKHGEQRAFEIWKFAETNRDLLQAHVIEGQNAAIDYHQRGAFSLAASSSEFNELRDVAAFMGKQRIPVQVLDGSDVRKRLGCEGFVGGIKYLEDAEVDPIKLLERLLEKCRRFSGFQFSEGIQVNGVATDSGGGRKVETSSGAVECSIVVLATNGFLPTHNDYFREKIYPTRGQMLLMEPVEAFMEAPCYANFYLDYFRQLPNGALLIGGFRQIEKDSQVGFSHDITESIQDALHEFVENHLPQFRRKKVTHRWAGVMGFSADGEPMVGSLPDDPQVFFCGGYTGHGIGMAFHVSKVCVDMIFGESPPEWLSARRF